MLLAIAATEFEMGPFLRRGDWQKKGCDTLITGVGPLETSVRLTRYLCENPGKIDRVVNFGIAGAYLGTDWECSLLDVCLAKREVLGDFGVCLKNKVEPLAKEITGKAAFTMDAKLLGHAKKILKSNQISYLAGVFVTVNGVSGTRKRGDMLQREHNGLCENMEGGAVARVCTDFSLPLLEIRCISNFVEDRDLHRWKIKEACEKSATIASLCIKEMITNS